MPLTRTVTLGPFLGLNNRLPAHALTVPERGTYLANAVNVDFDASGRLSRRAGFAKVSTLTSARSLFSDGVRTLYADGTALKRVTNFTTGATSTLATINGSNAVAYTAALGEVYYSDAVSLGRIDASNVAYPVGITVPAAPTAALIAGSLVPANYQYCITQFYTDEEGGASASATVEVTSSYGGIRLTLPSASTNVTHFGIYVSGPDGEVPRLHSKVTYTTTTVDITSDATGRSCLTENKAPLPAGSILAHLNGRLFSANSTYLYWSDAYNFGLYDALKNLIPFPASITIVAPCVNGLYVVADQTYWLFGIGTEAMEIVPVSKDTAVPGTAGQFPGGMKVFWVGEDGLMVGDSQGQVQNLTDKAVALDSATSGVTLYREDFPARIVASLTGAATSTQVHADYTASEAYRVALG